MPKEFICNLSTEELQRIYDEAGTMEVMCSIVGCKSTITLRKILYAHNIDTNKNAQRKRKTMLGLNDKQFELFLRNEYEMISMDDIAKELGVSLNIIRRFFAKYNIQAKDHRKRSSLRKFVMEEKRYIHKGDYTLRYCPEHPRNNNGFVREHVLVMEEHLGRYLKPGEIIHHIDCNKSNNDISNLALVNKHQHASIHAKIHNGIDKYKAFEEVMNNAHKNE